MAEKIGMASPRPIDDSIVQPIPIAEFLGRPVVLVDTYLRMPSGKFVMVAKAGQPTSDTSLEKYSMRNLESLYVHVDDYQRFLTTQLAATMTLAETGGSLKPEARIGLIQDAMTNVYREISDLGFSDQSYARAKLVNHALMSYVKDNFALADLIQKFGRAANDDDVAHAMMVSMVSVMIGMHISWSKPSTLEKLSLGGFLHDLGKTKIPPEIAKKPLASLTADERTIYESHVEAGVQLLAQSKSVPDDILLIVLEHHERADGSGFPKKLKDLQMSPLARVVSLASAFVDRVASASRPLSPRETEIVFEDFRGSHSQKFNRDVVKGLEKSLDPRKLLAARKRIAG